MVNPPEVPQRATLGEAYAAYASDPGSTVKQRAYFEAFPNDYASLRKSFGFEEISEDSVAFGEYYEQGNEMIGAFFKLDSLPVHDIAAKSVGIAHNGVWQEDGVGYFQIFLSGGLEKAPAIYIGILNTSPRAEQVGFWKFYMDGPEAYPKEDRSRLRALLVKEPRQLGMVDSLLALPRAEH
jgi:hypothetical protein